MTTRGINAGSDSFGIRSIRSKTHRLIVNLTPETEFTNACTTSPEFKSWVKKAEAGDERAAELVRRYQHRPPVELYEVTDGWHGFKNLADSPEHSQTLSELQTELDQWMQEQGDEGQATEMAALEHQHRGNKKGKSKGKGKKGKKKGTK